MLRNKCIPYYWNDDFNLIGHLKEITAEHFANTFKNMIDDIEGKIEQPFTVAAYFGKYKKTEFKF